jgi:hypothetical protein
MTTRTLTVQADQRAYVPHALCIVKRTTLIGQKHVLCGLAYAVGPDRGVPPNITFGLFLCLLFGSAFSGTAVVSRLS